MRRTLAILMALMMCLAATSTAFAQDVTDLELTLELAYGSRTGTYTGSVTDGLPDGQGAFTTTNDDDDAWTYTGAWVNGHMQGQGSTVWPSYAWRSEGEYANDMLNGQGAEYNNDALIMEGLFVDDVIASGKAYDGFGNVYYDGEFVDGFRVESSKEKDAIIRDFFYHATEYDYDAWLEDYDAHIGQRVYMTGGVSNNWESSNAFYDDFELAQYGGTDHWVINYGYLAVGETKKVKGDQNILTYGVVIEKSTWTDADGKEQSEPMIFATGSIRLDFDSHTQTIGSTGSAVKALQKKLKALGYYTGSIDGVFGRGCEKAVAAFQASIDLPADGVASVATLYLLYATPWPSVSSGGTRAVG